MKLVSAEPVSNVEFAFMLGEPIPICVPGVTVWLKPGECRAASERDAMTRSAQHATRTERQARAENSVARVHRHIVGRAQRYRYGHPAAAEELGHKHQRRPRPARRHDCGGVSHRVSDPGIYTRVHVAANVVSTAGARDAWAGRIRRNRHRVRPPRLNPLCDPPGLAAPEVQARRAANTRTPGPRAASHEGAARAACESYAHCWCPRVAARGPRPHAKATPQAARAHARQHVRTRAQHSVIRPNRRRVHACSRARVVRPRRLARAAGCVTPARAAAARATQPARNPQPPRRARRRRL